MLPDRALYLPIFSHLLMSIKFSLSLSLSRSVRLFGGRKRSNGDSGLGAVKRQKLFPPVPLTTQIERNDAQARRPAGRRSFNTEKKTGRDGSDRILLDSTGLEENPIRNVAKKIQSETYEKISIGSSLGREFG